MTTARDCTILLIAMLTIAWLLGRGIYIIYSVKPNWHDEDANDTEDQP